MAQVTQEQVDQSLVNAVSWILHWGKEQGNKIQNDLIQKQYFCSAVYQRGR